MMTSLLKAFLIVLIVFLFISCSSDIGYRQVTVTIPVHPWEEEGQCLWYSLKWTDKDNIRTQYVDKTIRNVKIKIPLGETVCICAFPLGDMEPYGTCIIPSDNRNIYQLSQNGGHLARIIMEREVPIRSNINFPLLENACYSLTDDFRRLDEVELISGMTNGKLTKASVKLNTLSEIPELSVLNGIWISENEKDPYIQVFNSKIPPMKLPPGTHRFYCRSQTREIRISIDYSGSISAVMKQSMVPTF